MSRQSGRGSQFWNIDNVAALSLTQVVAKSNYWVEGFCYDVHEISGLPEQLEATRQYFLRRIDDGNYTPHIAKTFRLAEIGEAHRRHGVERALPEDWRFGAAPE